MTIRGAAHGNPRTHAMVQLHSAWTFLRQRRVLVWALLLSATLHLSTYMATPFFIHGWRDPPAARFDAVLVADTDLHPHTATAPAPAASRRPARALRTPRTNLPRPVAPPKSEADFVGPENAIAVAASQPDTEDMGPPLAPVAGNARDSAGTAAPLAASSPSGVNDAATPSLVPAAATAAATDNTAKVQQADIPAVELPARISIAYKMSSSISDGVADYTWKRDGPQFEIDSTMQATGFIVGNFVGVLHQVSRGEVTPAGLRPITFRIRRGDVVPDSAEFDYTANELRMTRANGQTQTTPLPPRLQDMQSFLFQLAFDAPKLLGSDDALDVMVTNARKVYRHRFRQVGAEVVKTRSGPVQTIHLRSEAADPEDVYEVWLAPGNFHLPVKLKFYAGRFPVELIATSIRTTP